MTTTNLPETPDTAPDVATPAEVLTHIAAGLADGLPDLLDIGFMTPSVGYPDTSRGFDLRLPDNGEAAMPAWAWQFEITDPVQVDDTVHDTPRRSWRSHDVGGRWRGWGVKMWCAVDEPAPEQAEVSECACPPHPIFRHIDACPLNEHGGAQ